MVLLEIKMKRIFQLRNEIDKHLEDVKDDDRVIAIRHLYGVSDICALLALRRNLDSITCTAAGLLHDLWSFKYDIEENHAKPGAILAKEILDDIHSFDKHEIDVICHMIKHHSDKGKVDGEYDELLKDADVIHHFLNEPERKYVKSKVQRIKRSLRELGINIRVNKK